jgi:glycosyltransferase involved in cell wall biosynthesis
MPEKLKNILSPRPADLNYEDASVVDEFSDMLKTRQIDGVFIFSSFLASYVRLVPPRLKKVLDFDDVQFMRMKRMVEALPWGKKKVGYLLEPLKAKRFERLLLREFDLAFACSEVDRRKVLDLGSGVPVEVVANGVDPERFNPKDLQEWAHPSLVYTGGLGSQGGEGVLKFMEEIYPLIREEVPKVRLHLVGGEILPHVHRAALRDGSVVLEGMVDDVRPYMAGGWVFVVPLWIGSGTRLKILEASSMEKAVVSTPVGVEGLELNAGHHLFVEQTPTGFAERCVELLRDPRLRREMGQRAREAVCSRYNWSKIGRLAADLLEQLME